MNATTRWLVRRLADRPVRLATLMRRAALAGIHGRDLLGAAERLGVVFRLREGRMLAVLPNTESGRRNDAG